jgi:hypothetical protein
MKVLFVLFLAVCISACSNNEKADTEPYTKERTTVKSDPVASYSESATTNDSSKILKVELFEQKESLKYEVKFSYNGTNGEKIFSYPNLGFMPKPGLKKGAKPMSCIVGFYDADSVFMELRMIAVENENLMYRHLKEYQVEAEKK